MNKVTQTYLRFPLARRIEHWVMMLSFVTLGLTGIPQKFATSNISLFVINALGGIEVLRTIHSFDPCIACAVHTIDPEGKPITRIKVE